MFAGLLAAAVIAATLLAVLGLAVARRVLPRSILENHNTVIGHGYAVLSLFIGILLALMVVAVWERYVEAEEITEREANALADLYTDAAAFPEPDRTRLRERIREYVLAVETDEWRAMAEREESPRAWQAYAAIRRAYLEVTPNTMREALWLEQSLDRLDILADARRLRLLHSRARLPAAMWVVLSVLSLATIGFSYLFGVRDPRLHAVVSGAIAAALALTLTLIWALQRPFGHLAGQPPDAFVELREVMEESER